jgi:hypothetical protein
MSDVRKRVGRKLLVASVGVASMSFVACQGMSKVGVDAAIDTALDRGVAVDGAGDVSGIDMSTTQPDGAAGDTSVDTPGDATGTDDTRLDRQIVANVVLLPSVDDDGSGTGIHG